jgi:hypothetical protein
MATARRYVARCLWQCYLCERGTFAGAGMSMLPTVTRRILAYHIDKRSTNIYLAT